MHRVAVRIGRFGAARHAARPRNTVPGNSGAASAVARAGRRALPGQRADRGGRHRDPLAGSGAGGLQQRAASLRYRNRYESGLGITLSLGYRVDRHVSFSLALDNLSNQRYFVFNQQPGRTAYGELAYRF